MACTVAYCPGIIRVRVTTQRKFFDESDNVFDAHAGLASEVAHLRAALAVTRSPPNPPSLSTVTVAAPSNPGPVASVTGDAFAAYARNFSCPYS